MDTASPKTVNDAAPQLGAKFLEYNPGWVDRIGDEIRPTPAGYRVHAYTRDEPYGVVSAVTPFNTPIVAPSMVLGPVLAAGNTIVLKPSEVAPFAINPLGQLFLEAGFPPGGQHRGGTTATRRD
ncbi:MAG: aldehyde dehydrogenase family protein, partial [Pseudolabrys sp.]